MDQSDSNRFSNRKPRATERFLGVPSRAPRLVQDSIDTTEELHEDDVVFSGSDYYAEPNRHSSSTPPSSAATPIHHHSFGILAALPENETSPNLRSVPKFFHRASVSSAARLIPSTPRPLPQYRIPALSSSVKYHHSAPVNVPIRSEAMMKAHRRHYEEDEGEEEEEMLPPHEIVARNSAQLPMLACSVMEGRNSRNAAWRQTGSPD